MGRGHKRQRSVIAPLAPGFGQDKSYTTRIHIPDSHAGHQTTMHCAGSAGPISSNEIFEGENHRAEDFDPKPKGGRAVAATPLPFWSPSVFRVLMPADREFQAVVWPRLLDAASRQT